MVKLVLVDNDRELMRLWREWMEADIIAIDTETTGLDVMEDLAAGICLSIDGETGYYVSFAHVNTDEAQCSFEAVNFVMETLMRNPHTEKVFHNFKYDQHIILNTFGIRVVPIIHDTMVEGFIVDNTVRKGLKPWSEKLFGSQLPQLKEDLDKLRSSKKLQTYAHFAPSEIYRYGAADAVFTFKLHQVFVPKIQQEDQWSLYRMEVDLESFVLDMERNGVLIDQEWLNRAGEALDARIPIVAKELNEVAGWEFNPRSPLDVAKLLYDQLKMPVILRTATGKPSCAEEVLLNLPEHPIIPLILEGRTLTKIKSTYIVGILEKIRKSTGRLHCRFNQMGTGTGRFSSSGPNLQNIPREGSVPVSIRGAFVASPGTLLVFIDYSQMEMRMFAHYSKDGPLIEAVAAGTDFHLSTAAVVFHKPPEEITKAERKFAKKVNFGYIYGIGAGKLARDLQISVPEAKRFLERYNRTFPGVPKFMEETKADFSELGYVWSQFGRKRFIPWDKSYRAVNTLVQGSSADVLKFAMLRLQPLMRQLNMKPIMTIHDEIVWEVPFDELKWVPELVRIMQDFKMRVPIIAEPEWAHRWSEKHDFFKDPPPQLKE